MKKIISFLLPVLLLTACYEDKGNYEFSLDSMNEILSVNFSPSIVKTAEGDVVEVQQALDENSRRRRVDAIVEQSLATNFDDLDFYWCRTYVNELGKGILGV